MPITTTALACSFLQCSASLQAALTGAGIDTFPQEVITFARRWQGPLLPSNSSDVAQAWFPAPQLELQLYSTFGTNGHMSSRARTARQQVNLFYRLV